MAAAPNISPTLRLYSPFDGQRKAHESTARFRALTTGRRWGKTTFAANEAVKAAASKPEQIVWWVAPVYKQTEKGYREVLRVLRKSRVRYTERKSLSRILLDNESFIEFHTATNFDNLRGEGVDLLIIDEAPYVEKRAWTEALRATLSDKRGRAIFIGTPKGRNWFWEEWNKGQDRAANPEYESWKFPSASSPFMAAEEVESARRGLPTDTFRQEYLAEFLEESAGVFRNIKSCVVADISSAPQAGHRYVIGWDPAKHEDFSVIMVLDCRTRQVVYFDRFNQIDYTLQLSRLEVVAKRYHARVLMDCTGVGDPLLENAKKLGISVSGFMFSGKSKQQLIEGLALAIERRQILYPDWDILLHELQLYQYELTRARNVVYSAPEGEHDDTVTALALAVHAARSSRMFQALGEAARAAEESTVITPAQQIPVQRPNVQEGWTFDPITRTIRYPDSRITGGGPSALPLPANLATILGGIDPNSAAGKAAVQMVVGKPLPVAELSG